MERARLHRRHSGISLKTPSSSPSTSSNGGSLFPQSIGAPATTEDAAGMKCCSGSPLQVSLRKLGRCIQVPSASSAWTLSRSWAPPDFPQTAIRQFAADSTGPSWATTIDQNQSSFRASKPRNHFGAQTKMREPLARGRRAADSLTKTTIPPLSTRGRLRKPFRPYGTGSCSTRS